MLINQLAHRNGSRSDSSLSTAESEMEETELQKQGAFSEYWHYRELFFFLVWRDIKVRYKQTALGAAWAVIQPFMMMIVFTVLFGKVAKLPSDGIPYPIFYYAALLPWTFFSSSLSNSGNSLVANSNLITKIYFPRFLLPASACLSGLLDFFIATLLLLAMMWYYDMTFSPALLLWPVLIFPLLVLAMGAGLLLSSLNVNYRDIKHTIPYIVQVWMFLSPVVYPTSMIPEKFRFLASLNPVGGVIEAFRSVVVADKAIDWQAFLISTLISFFIFFLGYTFFRKTEREFADVI